MTTLKDALANHEVRLFSCVSISSEREAEMRATSAFLSIVKAVAEYGKTIVKAAGGPVGNIECYTEVELMNLAMTKKSRPDGVICVTRGKKEWKALVEVKVGPNGLAQEQFDRYHILAKEYDFDALITISNQAAYSNGYPPLKVDLRRVKSTTVLHFSWERLLSEAQLLSWQDGVSDEDQRYMLEEWIRYVNDSAARIVVAPRVGPYWNDLIRAAASDQLISQRQGLEEFVNTWCGFLRIQAFRLRALLGERVDVRYRLEEKKKPELFIKRLISEAMESDRICSSFNIPNTAGDLDLLLDLRSKRIFFDTSIAPPKDKTTKGQLGWIVSQLRKIESAPPELSLIIEWKKRGVLSKVAINGIADNRDALLLDMQKNLIPKEVNVRMFRIQWETKFPRKNAELFTTIGGNLEKYYNDVLEHLVAYAPPAPKISRKESFEVNTAKELPATFTTPNSVNIAPWREQLNEKE